MLASITVQAKGHAPMEPLKKDHCDPIDLGAELLPSWASSRTQYSAGHVVCSVNRRLRHASRLASLASDLATGPMTYSTNDPSTPGASASPPYSEALSDVSSPRACAGKRGSTDAFAASLSSASVAPDQKRRRLEGSPAVEVPRNPRTEARPAIAPSTGYDPGAGAACEAAPHGSEARHAHRATPEDVEPPLDPRAVRRQLDELEAQACLNREIRHWAADKFDRYADDLKAAERVL
ncbi:hypothetical protein PR003_g7097 [Phytophthora rubi]|uniref:Uncharacterized protein n=1 Tax=Phytophthora rubi TaxID=129364 RepID=A0A6A4FKT7_9STRA|nr:hypothetical protein PR002_g2436 [Phytophthora rubi]KAE9347086.1 hypothetical protein PR003_g7097 [Phytophthora rubi]